jgi:hypothetical protein
MDGVSKISAVPRQRALGRREGYEAGRVRPQPDEV